MKKKGTENKEAASWRTIKQGSRRAVNTQALQHRRLKFLLRLLVVLFAVLAILAGLFSLRYFGEKLQKVTILDPTQPELELDFRTDGVLQPSWFMEAFAEWVQRDVRDVDVRALKDELERYGQVADALVKVELPSSLVVEIEERIPLLRVRARGESGRAQMYLIARDGTLYGGEGYPVETLRALPGVAGLKLRRLQGDFVPIEGIEQIADLLESAKDQLPAVFRHWRLLDLSDWDPTAPYRTSLIRVRSTHVQEIIFGTADFEGQIKRLATILESIQRQQIGQPAFIDLSYPEEAVIRYR